MEGGLAAAAAPPASDPRFSRLRPGFLAGGVPGAPLPLEPQPFGPRGLQDVCLFLSPPARKQRWRAPCWPLATGPPVQAARLASGSLCSHGTRCPLPDLAQRDMDVGASDSLGVEGLQSRELAGLRSQEARVHQQQPPAWLSLRSGHAGYPQCPPGEQGDLRCCPGMGNWDMRPARLPKECSFPLGLDTRVRNGGTWALGVLTLLLGTSPCRGASLHTRVGKDS